MTCLQLVQDLFMTHPSTCSWLVHQLVHDFFMTCLQLVLDLFMTSHDLSWLLLDLSCSLTCSWHVYDLFTTCLWLVHDMFMTCAWLVYNWLIVYKIVHYPWFVHNLFMSCLWISHQELDMIMSCSWIVYNLLMTCTWCVHYLFISYYLFTSLSWPELVFIEW